MTFTSKASRFKSKFITAELANLFSQSDSEEEFEGFDEEEDDKNHSSNKRLKTKPPDSEEESDVDTGFYSDGDEAPPPKRKSLLVALRFPIKRLSSPKQETLKKKVRKPVKETPPPQRTSRRQATKKQQQQQQQQQQKQQKQNQQQQKQNQQQQQQKQQNQNQQQQQQKQRQPQNQQQKQNHQQQAEEEDTEEDNDEVLAQSLKKRDKNIRENKAMLAKLFADLSSMADLTLPNTPQKKKRVSEKATSRKRKAESDIVQERRNPSRKARPPENFAVEEKSEPLNVRTSGPRSVDIKRLVEVDEEIFGERKKKRKSHTSRRSQYEVKSVDEITEEDLDNIACRSKDKIWDKENGSSCHQCRQKTLDTKTVCRSGFCVGGKGQFCGPCLKNRYGEDVRTVLLDPTWSCPLCREMCNCSLCRKKEGRCATGILVGLARYNGHDNVHKYLESIQKELQ